MALGSQRDIDVAMMQLALSQAQLAAAQQEVPVGAIVVRDGEVLAQACNQPITNCDPTAHAEILACRQAALHLQNYRLNGCTLYVTLEPCAMCAAAILQARLARVVFAAWDPKAGAVGSCHNLWDGPQVAHRVAWTSGVLQSECGAVLQEFFAKRR